LTNSANWPLTCHSSCLSGHVVVSKGVYGKYVCTLRTLSVSSCFPRYKHETLLPLHVFVRPPHAIALVLPFLRLPFNFVAHRLHVFAPVLPAHLLLEAAALDARNPIPALRTLCRYGFVVRTDNGFVLGDRRQSTEPLGIAEATRTCQRRHRQVTCTSLRPPQLIKQTMQTTIKFRAE
jgi:hypothetical protein